MSNFCCLKVHNQFESLNFQLSFDLIGSQSVKKFECPTQFCPYRFTISSKVSFFNVVVSLGSQSVVLSKSSQSVENFECPTQFWLIDSQSVLKEDHLNVQLSFGFTQVHNQFKSLNVQLSFVFRFTISLPPTSPDSPWIRTTQ